MSRIFVGQFISEEESLLDKRISQAGNNYQLKFIDMLSPEMSISLYPIFLKNKAKSIIGKRDVIVINNQSILPQALNKICRLLFDTIEALNLILKSNIDNVFFYNIDKQNILIIWLTKILFKKNVYIVLADYPYFQNKSLFDKFANTVIRKIDGVITLNSNTSVNRNQKNLPGLLRSNEIFYNTITRLNKNVLLSGSLGFSTGIEIALQTFSKKPDYNLYITGRPYNIPESEFDMLINSYTRKYNNIKYLGLLDFDGYKEVLNKCDIALSLRNPKDQEHRYNFPSKILEYLSHSKLVISSLHYSDLPKEFVFYSEFDVVSLHQQLDEIIGMDSNTIMNLKGSIFNYLKNNYTEEALRNICTQLINKHDATS